MGKPVRLSPQKRRLLAFGLLAISSLIASIYLILFVFQLQQAKRKADITIDFGSRQNSSYPISPTFLGVDGTGMQHGLPQGSDDLSSASFRLTRTGGAFEFVFPTEASLTNPIKQVWTKFDSTMTLIRENNLQPILVMDYTPAWLQPQNQHVALPNPCLTNSASVDSSHVKPTYIVNGKDLGPQKWGALASIVVAHMDKIFPTLHPLYEIWNEPDGTKYWCEAKNDANAEQDRLIQYKALYAAAAPLMKQQAQVDGRDIKIGGPALAWASKRASIWIPSLVNDPKVAPYVDFISYHHYTSGKTWSDLLAVSQDPRSGYASQFQQIASYIRAGKQPNAQFTPVYIDEYNGNPCNPKLCRNDPTYAPLWNSLFLADLLNTVINPISSSGTAQAVPTGLSYFTWNVTGFCMFGSLDANLDCASSSKMEPYPQYYAYRLIGGTQYLDITNAGYVAKAASAIPPGLVITAFYTKTKNNILIINPTGKSYSQLVVLAKNSGSIATTASLYTLNQANPHIGAQPVALSQENDDYMALVDVPAYSTVALSMNLAH